ncbi:hypothetical protein DSECCO2_480160 [anaerobic digester metagenome]
MNTLEQIRQRAVDIWKDAGLMDETVEVTAAPLTVEQAIGKPEGRDFPIQKGKEKLMEARFKGAKGQAFTDSYGNYQGTLADIARLDLTEPRATAVFVATLNAVMRSMNFAAYTIHCKDSGPAECSSRIAAHIRERHGAPKIGMAGFQPAMIKALSGEFTMRVLDLDPDNIGQVRHGALIEGGNSTADVLRWADLLLVTGTTLANGTIDMFLTEKPVIFYGTTIAGAAALMGWERFCPCSM